MNNRFLAYANEAVLPFYILHQTVIITIGYYVVQWNIDIALKYLIIASTSFIVIMAVYELLVRRFNVLRFLFGMKIKKTLKTLLVET
jgi:glucan biosynthesis protein C